MNSFPMSRLWSAPLAALCGVLLMVLSQSASAVVIASQLDVDGAGPGPFFGQSVVTGAGGPWNNIEFNFFTDLANPTEAAVGNLFILTQEYLGTPAALDSGTAGYLAQSSSIVGGRWIFDPSAVLQPLTTYWFLMDDAAAFGESLIARFDNDPSTSLYFGTGADISYATNSNDFAYVLQGDSVSVPEPATFGLLGIGLLGIGPLALGLARRRRAQGARSTDTP